jgi:putative GTP pyrophosphokinase
MSDESMSAQDSIDPEVGGDVANVPAPDAVPATDWECDAFLAHCGLSLGAIAECGLAWEELAAIYDDHKSRTENLATNADYIANVLRRLPNVHTVRVRIKKPEHLVTKILRKRVEARREINFANYRSEITDLIGLRALHLYKEEWREVHEFISGEWELAEPPKAYIRTGDPDARTKEFQACGCHVEAHPRSYRSVHYLVKSAPSKSPVVAEIQVRTIFEEGWSEIDHRINYPVAASPVVGIYLAVFNRLAGMADEMGSFLHVLVSELEQRDEAATKIGAERDDALERVEELVAKLEITEGKRGELQDQLRKLRVAATVSSNSSGGHLSPLGGIGLGLSRMSAQDIQAAAAAQEVIQCSIDPAFSASLLQAAEVVHSARVAFGGMDPAQVAATVRAVEAVRAHKASLGMP